MAKSSSPTSASAARAGYPVLLLAARTNWVEWLQENHAAEPGVWMRFAKKAAPFETVTYAEALDVALCYGWIDGQLKKFDAHSYLLKFTPRGKKSIWSKVNVGHVERLITSGDMQPAGLAAVESAKRDGRWDRAYCSSSVSEVPEDLQHALELSPHAQAFFNTLKRDNRYAILFRIQTAVKAETRVRRIAQFVAMLERAETIHPVKPA